MHSYAQGLQQVERLKSQAGLLSHGAAGLVDGSAGALHRCLVDVASAPG